MAIPLALLGAFLGMWWGGVAGNLISLGAIDFGLVVDGAIIIVENAQRRIAERKAELGRSLTDEERRETVSAAAREVRSATALHPRPRQAATPPAYGSPSTDVSLARRH